MGSLKNTQRTLFIEGNSLMSWDANHTVPWQYYVPLGIYNSLRTGRVLNARIHPVGGQTQTEINALLSTRILPYIGSSDIYFIWEGTNDMYVNGLTGTQAFDNLLTCIQTIKTRTDKIVVGTVAARDHALDSAALMNTYIPDYNSLVRSNAATYGYKIVDFASRPEFATRAAASNTTYYDSDKLHLVHPGKDIIISMATANITEVL